MLLFSCKNNKSNYINLDSKFYDYQIEIIKGYQLADKEYTLAYNISGFHDKIIFIELYNINIKDKVGTNQKYIKPIFSEYVDQKFDKEEKATRYPKESKLDIINKRIVIIFNNNEKEIYDIKDLL
jgi:hypothetical protein